MNFSKDRIDKILKITFGILISLIILTTQWNIWISYQISKRVKDIYTQEVKSLENLTHIKSALYRLRDRTLRLIDANNTGEILHHRQKMDEQINRILNKIDQYNTTRLSSEEKKELENFKINLGEYLTVLQKEVYPFLNFSPKEKLEKALYRKALKDFREARESLNRLIGYQIKRAKERYKHAEEILKQEIIFTELILLIIVIGSIYYSHRVSRELSRLANYDDLTNLPNRKTFTKKLEECIKNYKEKDEPFAVMFIDIDDFKKINDIHGHFIGDKALEIIAKRIKSIVREEDLLARLGGDEFGLILCNVKDPKVTQKIAEKILLSTKNPINLNNTVIFISMSIGIYIPYKKNITQTEILSYADIAMYKAKHEGKSQYIFFSEEMYREIEEEIKLENDLKSALIKREFKIYYQPIIDIQNDRIYGAEVLLRWEKDGQIIPPYRFIPKLESLGLINHVTYWIIEEVFKMINEEKFGGITSINLSILQFFDENFIHFLQLVKEKYPSVSPDKIRFEITESVFAKNSKQISHMMDLIKNEGFLFALDDFGTGYSSLSYIKDYPINTIKIDRKFIENLIHDAKSQALLDGIIFLANKIGLTVILEGIECKETLAVVSKYKNIKAQGYYYYKPMPENEFKKLVRRPEI